MIALTKSGYEKFIKGTIHFPTDIKVVVLSAQSTGLSNSVFTTSNVNVRRAQANPNNREFSFDDFEVVQVSNRIDINGQLNLNTQDFAEKGDEQIDNNGAVIDVSDNDDLVGAIILYPSSDPITYSALNSAPVNIDYTATSIARMTFKSQRNSGTVEYANTGLALNKNKNQSDHFINSILNLPIFNSSTETNLLSDMKIALLSSVTHDQTQDTDFSDQLYSDSLTASTLENLDSSSHYHYISGGYTFRNLGLATDAGFACLTATDSTIYIPGLTINEEVCFAVVYYEDTAVISPGDDVMTEQYKSNSYVLNNICNLDTTTNNDGRFAFKQSVIIDSLFDPSLVVSTSKEQIGIMALNNTVGPGLNNSNVNSDIS